MDQGAPEADVITAMTQQNSGFNNDLAAKFAKVAEAVYCPAHLGGAPNTDAGRGPPPMISRCLRYPRLYSRRQPWIGVD